jgi:hypothetical protein
MHKRLMSRQEGEGMAMTDMRSVREESRLARPTAGGSLTTASRSAQSLLDAADRCLADASRTSDPPERYVAAHLAALRAAAAVLAARARPADRAARARRPTSVWVLLATLAPELGEWATFFAAGAAKRQAAEAGVRTAIGQREADDLMRDAETFIATVRSSLGSPWQLRPAG